MSPEVKGIIHTMETKFGTDMTSYVWWGNKIFEDEINLQVLAIVIKIMQARNNETCWQE